MNLQSTAERVQAKVSVLNHFSRKSREDCLNDVEVYHRWSWKHSNSSRNFVFQLIGLTTPFSCSTPRNITAFRGSVRAAQKKPPFVQAVELHCQPNRQLKSSKTGFSGKPANNSWKMRRIRWNSSGRQITGCPLANSVGRRDHRGYHGRVDHGLVNC